MPTVHPLPLCLLKPVVPGEPFPMDRAGSKHLVRNKNALSLCISIYLFLVAQGYFWSFPVLGNFCPHLPGIIWAQRQVPEARWSSWKALQAQELLKK